jgi:hypothetical protein
MVLAILCWKYLKREGHDSHWRFLSAILANLVNQSVSIGKNRLILIAMLQIFILSTYYLRNLYESDVTSVLTDRLSYQKFRTFDELLTSKENFSFMVDDDFLFHLKNHVKFDAARIVTKFTNYSHMAESNVVLVSVCSQLDAALRKPNRASFHYFMLPEKMIPSYVQYDVGVISPYIDKWQTFMDYAFETGLTQIWERMYSDSVFGVTSREETYESSQVEPLSVRDVYKVFMILPIGLGIAFFVFLCEILYHYIYQRIFLIVCDILVA